MKIITISQESYQVLENEIVHLYQNSFSEPPWYEAFEYSETNAYFQHILTLADNVFLSALNEQNQVIGATAYFPPIFKQEVAKIVDRKYRRALYCAELFVDRKYRCRSIGNSLIASAHEKAKKLGYENIVLRTSQIHQPLIDFYKRRGFRELTFMQCHSIKLIDGRKEKISDPRVIFVRSLITDNK